MNLTGNFASFKDMKHSPRSNLSKVNSKAGRSDNDMQFGLFAHQSAEEDEIRRKNFLEGSEVSITGFNTPHLTAGLQSDKSFGKNGGGMRVADN